MKPCNDESFAALIKSMGEPGDTDGSFTNAVIGINYDIGAAVVLAEAVPKEHPERDWLLMQAIDMCGRAHRRLEALACIAIETEKGGAT